MSDSLEYCPPYSKIRIAVQCLVEMRLTLKFVAVLQSPFERFVIVYY